MDAASDGGKVVYGHCTFKLHQNARFETVPSAELDVIHDKVVRGQNDKNFQKL